MGRFRLIIILSFFSPLIFCQTTPNYLIELSSYKQFEALQSAPIVTKYSDIQSVKVVYDMYKKNVYFINGNAFELHHTFCYEELNYKRSISTFNRKNYNDTERRFCLVNLNYFKETDTYIVEYNVSDNISIKNISTSFKAIQKVFFDSLKMVLNNNTRINKVSTFDKLDIPYTYPQELFKNQKNQIVTIGKTSGFLKHIKSKEELFTKDSLSESILVVSFDMLEIPACKGIITTQYQTPLSHISLLSKNRGIPVLVYPKLMTDSLFTNLFDKPVHFELESNNYTLYEDFNYTQPTSLTKERKTLAYNAKSKKIKSLSLIRMDEKGIYGTKAVHLAELGRVKRGDYKTPEGGFGIPFAYYVEHIADTLILNKINILLSKKDSGINRLELNKQLKKIRKAIERKTINASLLTEIKREIITKKVSERYRFRSSSNAEDLDGFNGAGLYTSKTGILNDSIKTIERAIKKVWASVWSLRAFEEREIFNIDHKTVAMAVLAHRSFPNDIMNGVAVTSNLYRDYNAGFVLNQQVGENRVVDNDSVIPEQLISYFNSRSDFFNLKDATEYITTSSLNDSKPILTSKEIFNLTKQLNFVKLHFYRKLKGTNFRKFALDIEYKISPDLRGKNKLYIKQVRLLSKD